jgi:hypothetical protein
MSLNGPKQREIAAFFTLPSAMSAFGGKADIDLTSRNVRF